MNQANDPDAVQDETPKALSYPLGAEAISDALAGAPYLEQFTLAFRDRPGWRASDFQHLLREGLPYPIFAAEYDPGLKPGYGGPTKLIERGLATPSGS